MTISSFVFLFFICNLHFFILVNDIKGDTISNWEVPSYLRTKVEHFSNRRPPEAKCGLKNGLKMIFWRHKHMSYVITGNFWFARSISLIFKWSRVMVAAQSRTLGGRLRPPNYMWESGRDLIPSLITNCSVPLKVYDCCFTSLFCLNFSFLPYHHRK